MARYQIVYSKRGFPLTFWINDKEMARSMATNLRKVGYYDVNVWVHTKDGAHMTDM